jgi:hypothetical protein
MAMLDHTPSEPVVHGDPLHDLLRRVQQARARLRSVRASGAAIPAVDAQRDLCDALTDFTSALTSRGLPVPYALRDELHIYTDLVNGRHRRDR